MRRLVTWLLVTLGIAALVRKLRKREEPEWTAEPASPSAPPPRETVSQAPSAEEVSGSEGGDPAAELRERLARSRADMPSSAQESPEERRSAVHEQGRAALDEMQPSGESPESTTEPAPEEQ
jgi:hypothetical protein